MTDCCAACSHHRLYSITNFANRATQEYLVSHEVRFICVIPSSSLRRGLSQVCDAGKKHRLNLQHFFTTSSSCSLCLASGDLDVRCGDTVVEIVGIQEQGTASFQRFSLSISGASVTPITATEMKDVLKSLSGVQIDLPCSLCLVKPHVMRSYRTGDVLQAINDGGFDIFAMFSVHLTIPMAEELFDAYRGVVPDYAAMIDTMCSSPVLALAITVPGCDDYCDVVTRFRDFAGPVNPALAKVLRPDSLRSLFGENQLLNAVHCTDLPEDGEMECRYFFESLANL